MVCSLVSGISLVALNLVTAAIVRYLAHSHVGCYMAPLAEPKMSQHAAHLLKTMLANFGESGAASVLTVAFVYSMWKAVDASVIVAAPA